MTNNPLVFLLKTMWTYAKGNRRQVVLYISLSVLSCVVWMLEPLVIGLFLNRLQVDGITSTSLHTVYVFLGLLMLTELAFWSLHGPSRILEHKNAFYVRAQYKQYLLDGTLALPLVWHADHHSGDTIDKIEKGTDALYNFSQSTFEIIQGVSFVLSSLVALFWFSPLVGWVTSAMALGTFAMIALFDKQLVAGYKLVNELLNGIAAKLYDGLSNVNTVITLRVTHLISESVRGAIWRPFAPHMRNVKTNEVKWAATSIIGRLMVVVVLVVYIATHLNTGLLAGTVFILYQYADQIRNAFFRFAYLYGDVVSRRAAVANSELLSAEFEQVKVGKTQLLPKDWQTISVANLRFSYDTSKKSVKHLSDVSLTIRSGQRIALIGESGGGKTTLLKVMRDLYTPQSLELLVDGQKVRGGFAGISDSIALIPQDPEVFASTVKENITLGVDYSENDLQKFIAMACFTDVMKRLPKGLDSSIVEKGVNLSGGEKQRLALARGLLASVDKDIVLLDEPTSSVDFHNELQIYQNIFMAFPQKTVVSSIHRLHLLSLFDTVYFFKRGKIIASGSFAELKKSSPDFQELWKRYTKTRDSVAL